MKFSIVIPTFQRSALLRETLDSLSRQTDKDFEVVVVCDGHDPATRTLADQYQASYPLKWIFQETNKGQATARNEGAFAAGGELLAFLDDDTTPIDDWLALHRTHHKELGRNRIVAVCGKIVETYERPPNTPTEGFLRSGRDRYLAEADSSYRNMRTDFSQYVYFGVNSSIRKDAFLDARGFDPALRSFHEDLDLGLRLHNRGIPFVFEDRAIIYHRSTKDLCEYFRDGFRLMATTDVYRARDRGQRNPQTARLTTMQHGNVGQILFNRLCWKCPKSFARLTRWCERAVDAAASELLF